jgi:hypothetical protein
MVSRASCGASPPEQLALIAAHEGTATGLAAGLGVGTGLGVSVGCGLGAGLDEGLASTEGDGLVCEADAELEQPAMASIAMTAASLIPTGNCNAGSRGDVTAAGGVATEVHNKPAGFRSQ